MGFSCKHSRIKFSRIKFAHSTKTRDFNESNVNAKKYAVGFFIFFFYSFFFHVEKKCDCRYMRVFLIRMTYSHTFSIRYFQYLCPQTMYDCILTVSNKTKSIPNRLLCMCACVWMCFGCRFMSHHPFRISSIWSLFIMCCLSSRFYLNADHSNWMPCSQWLWTNVYSFTWIIQIRCALTIA